MQAARGAVKDLREKGKQFVKPKYADSLLGSGLEEQIRRATAKTLPGPDLALNRRIVDSINTDLNEYSAHQLASVLKSRLTLKNAHKQWLAIELIGEILEGCPKVIESARSEILEDVAQIAAQPMNRYGSDLPGQQHCKNASFALLKKNGHEAQDAMREAVGLPSMVRAGSGDSPHLSQLGGRNSHRSLSNKSSSAGGHSSSDNSFGAVRERVQMGIATSQSHTEMLQDLVLSLSSAEGKRDIETEKNVLKDLVKEMVLFRNKFEQSLEALSSYETHEAQTLMTEALEAMDMMNNAIVLQNEVLTARKNTRQNSAGRSHSGGASSGAASRLAPPPGSASASASGTAASPRSAQPAQPAAPAPAPAQPSYLDILSELQQAMERPTMAYGSSAPQANDPFAPGYANAADQGKDPFGQSPGQQYSQGPGAQPSYGQVAPSQASQSHNPFAAAGASQGTFVGSGSNAYTGPGISRVTSTPPLASAQSMQAQQGFQQLNQNSHQQQFGPASQSYPQAQSQPVFNQPQAGQHQYQAGQQYQPSEGQYQAGQYQPQEGFQPQQGHFQPQAGQYQQQQPQSSYQRAPQQSYNYGQQLGPKTPNTSSEDPFAHLPYPALNQPFPRKPERAPAPPLSSYSSAAQLAQQQEQQRQQEMQQQQQEHQQQQEPKAGGSNAWDHPAQPSGAGAADDFGFDDNAFGPAQLPASSPAPPAAAVKEAARPRTLYVNNLYNEEPGAEAEPPAGFQPAPQGLARGTGSWGTSSPVSSPNKGGAYAGDSGPPTPEGLQYQHHTSAGSSGATTPAAQNAGNSEWDMFFADRIRSNTSGSAAPPLQTAQQHAPGLSDPFDELSSGRTR